MGAYAEGNTLSKADEARFGRLRAEVVGLVGGIHLHEGRIAELVERLREVNKRLTGAEGRLLRVAETAGSSATNSWSPTKPLPVQQIGWRFRLNRPGFAGG